MGTYRADIRTSGVVIDFQTRRVHEPEPSVSVRLRRFGRWTVVEVHGEMDLQAVALLAGPLSVNPTHLVFGLKGVTFMDACGLALLLDSRRKALAAAGCVRLAAPSPQARRFLRLTGTYYAFPRFHSLLEAVTEPVIEVPGQSLDRAVSSADPLTPADTDDQITAQSTAPDDGYRVRADEARVCGCEVSSNRSAARSGQIT